MSLIPSGELKENAFGAAWEWIVDVSMSLIPSGELKGPEVVRARG